MSPTSTPKKAPAKKTAKAALPRVAFIGMGIQARTMLLPQFLAEDVVVAAICDCDKVRREAGAKQANDYYAASENKKNLAGVCKPVDDFRKVIKDKTIDMVVIVTPDHWHAYMAVEAMKAGKDVYCEKPLTYSIEEAKLVMAAQKKFKRVFQTGAWQRSRREFRTAAMIVRNGLIGDVKYVDCNYGNASAQDNTDIANFHANLGGPSHPHRFFCLWDDTAHKAQSVAAESAPNPDVDWDMWLGPAPWSPYSDQCAPRGVNQFYPMFWRFDDNYGTGYNGDWGAHHLDIAQWGLDLDKSGPVKIVRSDKPNSTNPLHGGRRQCGMQFVFADGTVIHHNPFSTWGTVFYGTKGIVAVNRGKIAVWTGFDATSTRPTEDVRKALQDVSFMKDHIVAESVGKDYGTDAAVKADNRLDAALDLLEKKFAAEIEKAGLYVSPNQIQNFCECIDSRKMTISPAEVGGRSCTLCLLCNMSYVYDTGFDWDPVNMQLADGEAKGISTKREVYRNGWEIVV